MRILLVDKLASFRKRVRTWLVDAGHSSENILESSSGEGAMEILRREDFAVDAIVCEWNRTTVHAPELLSQIRSVPGFAHIGFLAVGGLDEVLAQEAQSLGATAYLPQPLDPEALMQALVAIEKQAIEKRKRVPSPTTRWRILTLDQKPPPEQAAQVASMTAVAEQELRDGARSVCLKKDEKLVLRPGDGLFWVEKGSVRVREKRSAGSQLEYTLAGGQFLGEAPFGGCPYVSLEAVAADGEAWLSSRDAGSVDQLRARHPVLFYSFRNIANERARRFQKAEDHKPMERGLSGELDSLPLGDIVQILSGAKKTGVLKIEAGEASWFLQFTQGTLRHAECDGEVGDGVFYGAIMLKSGRFEFMPGPAVEGPITIATDTRALLIEALRRRDQADGQAPEGGV